LLVTLRIVLADFDASERRSHAMRTGGGLMLVAKKSADDDGGNWADVT
jgi:hypothetical protein